MGRGSYPCTHGGSVFKGMSFSSLASHKQEGGLCLEEGGCRWQSPAPVAGMGCRALCTGSLTP